MPVMHILSASEAHAFETPPHFTHLERTQFFILPLSLQARCDSFRTPANKVCFLLACGYFKARRKFFGKQFRPLDVAFGASHFGFLPAEIETDGYDKQTALRQQQAILEFFGFCRFAQGGPELAARFAATQAQAHRRPKSIFLELVETLVRHHIALPKYYVLAGLLARAGNLYKQELMRLVEVHLPPASRVLLDGLLAQEDLPASAPTPSPQSYPLTLLKKFSHSAKPAKIKDNLAALQALQSLYRSLAPTLKLLGLTEAGLRYYAQAVLKAEIFQISRRVAPDRYLHLLAFIAYQTAKLQDLLADSFLQSVQTTLNTAAREHKELYFSSRTERRERFQTVLTELDENLLAAFLEIQTIIAAETGEAAEKLLLINELLSVQAAPRARLAEQLQHLKSLTAQAGETADYYALLARKSLKLQNRVSGIVRQMGFNLNGATPVLAAALEYFQSQGGVVERHAPLALFSQEEQEHLFAETGNFRVSLYKALLFIKLAAALKAGALNLAHSHKYRPLDDYLLPAESWRARRDNYLEEAELTRLADPQATLDELLGELDRQYHETNRHSLAGTNPLLKLHPEGGFHLVTPKESESESPSLRRFLPAQQYVSLVEVLATVQQATGFLNEFEHWQRKYRRPPPPAGTLLAGIIGYGCDIGVHKMARISQPLSESALETTVNWYFSLPNLQAANDRLLQVLDKLELPNLYRREAGRLHTSSDGQKFALAVDSLNANYSFKYFGQARGVSVYSFIDERHFLFHSAVISSAEREAAYVIDGLLHNEVVQSDIHSTDTHGYSELIFAVTQLLGFAFAPRIKRLDKQQLYSSEKKKVYAALGYPLLPAGYVDRSLIVAQWDDILRLLATLKLRRATASQLFKRLNSYAKQHPLYRALKEFGKIPKSQFILHYVDDTALRQAIEKQLNKIESAQKFSKAVSFGHHQEFLQSEKEDQEIAAGCRRLIKNGIICWNYLYLSQKLGEAKTEEDKNEIRQAVRDGSVVTWQHVNLHGEYDFSDAKLQDSMGLDWRKIEGLPGSSR